MRTRSISICLILLLSVGMLTASAGAAETVKFTGTVHYIPLEGGFWGLVTGDGKKYDPLNLAEEYRQEGLAVQVEARVRNRAGIHMWGAMIEIVDIRRLDPCK